MQVFLLILRETYGFNRKESTIPLWKFAEELPEMKKPSISRAIRKLTSMKLIIVSNKAKGASNKANKMNPSYCINKNYEKWEPLAKKLTRVSNKAKGVSNKAKATPSKAADTKASRNPKDSIKDTFKDKKIKDMCEKRPTTPAEIARDFFFQVQNPESRNGVFHDYEKMFDSNISEMVKFADYWTEPTPSGKKQKWEIQKTFEVGRRARTWMRNSEKDFRGRKKDSDFDMDAWAERTDRERGNA